ncbi:MAG: hypothetical protein L6R40_000193 [Gallowayella cf. fulva]|nr:MAG: hypothetical protein L6R40_000193 [Xanthomendoza cf. fulva]
MAAEEEPGLLDLQKELTCSICTEVLFQPLTLLDCLHTFCGSCLKEWFSWQATQASASKPNPYTCPSCRASVRETRPNATVTTLLDMYLQANPGRRRSQEEQADLKARYKPGEQVLPRVTIEEADAADERMLAEVREMSLRDAGVRVPGSYERGTRHRTAERRLNPSNDARQGRRHQRTNPDQGHTEANMHRRIGHQSSLRSLMSSSDIDSSEMEEEILRLVDEGWLDGIDLNNLDTSQVDELSERIAEAYRRRHGARSEITPSGMLESVPPTIVTDEHRIRNNGILDIIRLYQGLRRRTTDPDHINTPRPREHARSESTTTEQSTAGNSEHSTRTVTAQAPSRPTLPSRSSDPGQTRETSTLDNTQPRQHLSQPHETPSGALVAPAPAGLAPHAPKLYVEPSIMCNRCQRRNLQYELYWNCSRCHGGKYNLCSRCFRLGRGCLHWYGFGYAALQRYQRDAKDSATAKDLSPPHSLIGHRYRRPEPEAVQSSLSESGQKMTRQDPDLRLQFGVFCASCSSNANACFWKCASCNEGEWGYCNGCVNQGRCCTHPLLPVAHKLSLNSTTGYAPNPDGETTFGPALGPRSSSTSHFMGLSPPNLYVSLSLSTKCNICRYPIPPSHTRFHCPQCEGGDFNICTTSYLKLISAGHVSEDDGDKGWRRCPNGHRMIIVGFEDASAGQKRVVVKDLVGGLRLKDGGRSHDQATGPELSWQEGQQRHVRKVLGQPAAHQARDTATAVTPLLREYPPSGGLGMRALAVWSYWPVDEAHDELPFPRGAEIWEIEDINGDWFLGSYAGRVGLLPGNYVRVLEAAKP